MNRVSQDSPPLRGEKQEFSKAITACMCSGHHPEVPISAQAVETISGEPAQNRCLRDLREAGRDDVAQPWDWQGMG